MYEYKNIRFNLNMNKYFIYFNTNLYIRNKSILLKFEKYVILKILVLENIAFQKYEGK